MTISNTAFLAADTGASSMGDGGLHYAMKGIDDSYERLDELLAKMEKEMFRRERLENERLLNELSEAQTIQASLLPRHPADVSTFSLTGACLPCRAVGGDWYDYLQLPDGRVAVVLADVSGKGMGAALLMSSTRSILRLIAYDGRSPAEVLGRVNAVLLDDFPAARFVTMVYALLDPQKRSVVFANAGHLPPLLVEATSASFLETAEGLPLGIHESNFSERMIQMPPGSRLVLCSDGVTEASNSSMEEYGLARVQEHFSRSGSSLESLLDEVRDFSAGNPPSDDATVVVLEAR